MQGIFLSVIAIAQLFGAIIAFANLDAVMKQVPFSTLPLTNQLVLGWIIIVFLLGLIGAILIWVKRRIGIWLSLFHQLAIVPVVILPAARGFYVLGDAIAVALAFTVRGWQIGFDLKINVGTNSLLSMFRPEADAGIYGVNLFALICAIYLYKLLRRKVPATQAEAA